MAARRLLLVLAHPDDESMGNATLIARHVAAGSEVHLVCATRGGAGWNGLPPGRLPAELPEIRTAELESAAAVLGLAGVELWDYPDGGVPSCDLDEITGRIREAIERLEPAVVIGWGPDGGYRHPDHIAIGACTDRALVGSSRAHYHMALSRREAEAYLEAFRVAGVEPSTMALAIQDSVDAVFEPSPAELAMVRRAVACHESQLNEVIQVFLGDESKLYEMARNTYVRVAGTPPEVPTRLFAELAP